MEKCPPLPGLDNIVRRVIDTILAHNIGKENLTQDLIDKLVNGTYINEPTGFENRTDSSITFTDATRTFTITGTAFNIYISNKVYVKKTASIQITNTTGRHFVYYDSSSNLTESTSFPAS